MGYQVTIEELQERIPQMQSFFDQGHTLDLSMRINALKKLSQEIESRKEDICDAVYKDFHKPKEEMLLTEIFPTLAEINHTLSHISKWARPERVATNMLVLPASSSLIKSPKGLVFIIAPWNYAFYLMMMPIVSAIAAGNVVIAKPASETYQLSLIIKSILDKVFDKKHLYTITGDGPETSKLIFDNFSLNHVFFTGSTRAGKWIGTKAAEKLIPCTLELGGKSPAIIEKGYNLDLAAKKIVWGKYINCGQTCVATDYVLLPKGSTDAFVKYAIAHIHNMFGSDSFASEQYCHMINEARFDNVVSLFSDTTILHGGKYDKASRCIEPSIVKPHSMDSKIMKEEIFGPILPIIEYESKEEILSLVRKNRYPLALYIFPKSSDFTQWVNANIEYGGGCVNNTIYHLGNPNLPFGGIQNSGIGTYHGKFGFDTFSNVKAVLHSAKWFDISLLYQPYTTSKLNIIKKFFGI